MRLAIMQPYLFPYIGYFQLINISDRFVMYDDVAFMKQGWVNRNNILLNGRKHLFSVPIKNLSSFSQIDETYISEKPSNWTKKLISTITQSYSKAPFFREVFPMIEQVIANSAGYLISKVAKESVMEVLKYLELETKIITSSSIYGNKTLRSEERIIDICKKEGAVEYINSIGGKDLYSSQNFEKAGIRLSFVRPNNIIYKQFDNEFVPSLSIIDVLMFNSKEKIITEHMSNYALI
jgi:hypothetical protein